MNRGKSLGVPGNVHDKVIEILSDMRISAHSYVDFGGGDGKFTSRIMRIVGGKEVYCVDVSDHCLSQLPSWIKGVTFDLNSGDYPFKDDYFDLVSAVEVIEHLTNCDNLIKNSYRILKRGGHFIITTPNLSSWINRIMLLLGYQPTSTEPSIEFIVGSPRGIRKKRYVHGHLKLFTFKALKELLLVNGFIMNKCTGASLSVSGSQLLTHMDNRIASIFPQLATDLIVLANKQ